MRYTEARLSAVASAMLDDIKLDTVDYIPTYDEARTEPTVLPSKFPNLLVNGSGGIAVGMATSIPPHNPTEICDAVIALIDEPDIDSRRTVRDRSRPPTFPPAASSADAGYGIRRGYKTGRSTIVVRAKCSIEEQKREIARASSSPKSPISRLAMASSRRSPTWSTATRSRVSLGIRDESDLNEPVRLVIELKRDADPDVVLNQLYQFSPLQTTFSVIFLALVDGKPRELTLKEMLTEFIRHRVNVIRRRTQFCWQGTPSKAHGRRLVAGPGRHRRDHSNDSQQPDHPRKPNNADGDRMPGVDDAASSRR